MTQKLLRTHVCVWYEGSSVTVLIDQSDTKALSYFFEYGSRNSSADAKLFSLCNAELLASWSDGDYYGDIPSDLEKLALTKHTGEEDE